MFVQINPASGVPIYRQITDQVKAAVSVGQLAAGERLPSVRELSEVLVVNPTTIQRAYLDLEHEGVIEARRGQGTFVRGNGHVIPAAERARRVGEQLRHAALEAKRLGLDAAALDRLYEQMRRAVFGPESQSEDRP